MLKLLFLSFAIKKDLKDAKKLIKTWYSQVLVMRGNKHKIEEEASGKRG